MNKFFSMLAAVAILLGIFICASVQAGSVGDRAYFTGGTNCIGLWTNLYPYSALKLTSVRVQKAGLSTNVVTFYRVTMDDTNNVYTNAVGTVTCATAAGVQSTLTASIMKPGDLIRAVSTDNGLGAPTNVFTGFIEFEVQQH